MYVCMYVCLFVKSTKTTLVIFGLSVGAQMAEKADPCTEGSVIVIYIYSNNWSM